jgi:Helitron helicase-like domain at N-terminus
MQLIKDVTTGMIFGQVIGYTYSIKFQKRGLPHMHLLLILHSHDKNFQDPSKGDGVVSAEFPSNIQHPELFESVKTHMLHGREKP